MLAALQELLEPLVVDGTVRRRTAHELLDSIPLFTVVERENKASLSLNFLKKSLSFMP